MDAIQNALRASGAFLERINARTLLQIPVFPGILDQPRLAPYQTCSHPQLSCHNTSAVPESCCFNYPGGLFLQTQFWDARPAVGPADSWTIHGLWPDHCTGGFDQYCDNGRRFTNIFDILSSFNNSNPLLETMNEYWLSNEGSHEGLWAHEWNKHGSCINTLRPSCYAPPDTKSIPHPDVLDYFNTTVTLFRNLDTYTFLADAGIVPSEHTTYTLSQLESALLAVHGSPVTLRCHGSNLNEAWYHFSVLGPLQRGQFVPAKPTGQRSNCPPTGIRYLPKKPSQYPSKTSTTPHSSPTSTSTPEPFKGRGYLNVHVLPTTSSSSPSHKGCLISSGVWYTSGRCATYRIQDDVAPDPSEPDQSHYFTLASRGKVPCSINEIGAFECSRSLPFQTIFSAHELDSKDEPDAILSFRNRTTFYAANVPGKFEKVEIFADDGGDEDPRPVRLEISWEGTG